MAKVQLSLFNEFFESNKKEKYTEKITPPLYNPSEKFPNVSTLVDCKKTMRLIREIEKSNVSDEEKRFLIESSHRHSVFNYSRIADYYSHASKEMQELMEKSALVIVDLDRAIELGYVRFSENIRRIQEKTVRRTTNNREE